MRKLKGKTASYDFKYANRVEQRFGVGLLAKQGELLIKQAEKSIPNNAVILEIGCNTGMLMKRLQELFGKKVKKIFGKDVNSEAIQVAKERGFDASYGDAQDLKDVPNESIDIIFSLHTYEHIPNIGKGFKEIFRILKPGGKAYIMIPLNFYGLETIRLAKETMPRKNAKGILTWLNAWQYARRLHCSNLGGPFGGAQKHARKILLKNKINLKVSGKMHPELWFTNFLIFTKPVKINFNYVWSWQTGQT